MTQPVSAANIAALFLSFIISVGLPTALFIFARKKLKSDKMPLLIGAGTFLVFALILEKVVFNGIAFSIFDADALQSNVWALAIFGGLEAAVFEEVGRFVAMKVLMKKKLTRENAFMYGVGHGGVEAVILVGLGMISNIATCFMINSGTFDATLNLLTPEQQKTTLESVAVLWESSPLVLCMGGIERIPAIVFHIAASVIVYRAVKSGKLKYLWLALGLHFLTDAGVVVVLQYTSVVVTEIWIFVLACVSVFIAYRIYKNEKAEVVAEQAL
jgi:uncharacterized membrane protein YhfC